MKIKKYIEPKRQYTPPRIYVRLLQMEGHLAGLSIDGTDDGEGKDPTDPETQPDTDPKDPFDPFA